MLQTKRWFDSDGRYVPLSERNVRENDTFGRIFQDMDNVVEYDQVGGTLFVYSDEDPKRIKEQLETEHGGIRAIIKEQSSHTYRYIESDQYVRLEFTAK